MYEEVFWIKDITVLYRNTSILPNQHMTDIERLNALTRLVLVITLVLFVLRVTSWLVFLIGGIGIVLFLYYISTFHPSSNQKLIEHFTSKKQFQKNKRSFNIKPRNS